MREGPGTGVLLTRLVRQFACYSQAAHAILRVHMHEPARVIEDRDDTRACQRRAALVTILGRRAEPILERVVADTLRATEFAGLGRTAARSYAAVARGSLPVWLAALGAEDPERARIFEQNTYYVRELIGHGIPKFVQRSLVSFGFRLAQGIARDGAPTHGFEPDELEDELRVFQRAFEARLFYGA